MNAPALETQADVCLMQTMSHSERVIAPLATHRLCRHTDGLRHCHFLRTFTGNGSVGGGLGVNGCAWPSWYGRSCCGRPQSVGVKAYAWKS